MLGCRSRERDSNGLYLEHVLRMGSVLTAAQKARQCSEEVTGDPYFLWCRHPRDLTTDPRVHFYGSPSPNRSGGTGRTYARVRWSLRAREGVNPFPGPNSSEEFSGFRAPAIAPVGSYGREIHTGPGGWVERAVPSSLGPRSDVPPNSGCLRGTV